MMSRDRAELTPCSLMNFISRLICSLHVALWLRHSPTEAICSHEIGQRGEKKKKEAALRFSKLGQRQEAWGEHLHRSERFLSDRTDTCCSLTLALFTAAWTWQTLRLTVLLTLRERRVGVKVMWRLHHYSALRPPWSSLLSNSHSAAQTNNPVVWSRNLSKLSESFLLHMKH